MRVAIYIRVSTLDQAERGYSLDAQERILRKWCVEHNHESILYADRGISGKDIAHRPGMLAMMRDAESHKFEMVLVWSLSRLTRSVRDLYSMLDALTKNNIALKSYTEAFDTSTSMGRAMVGILGIFAQLEREITAERVRASMAERAKSGKRTCNEVLGYDKLGKDSFVINQAEAERIRFIFDTYEIEKNYTEVARQCADHSFRGKRGRVFKAEHIKQILTRPIYVGYNTYQGKAYLGNHEPIIDESQWCRVQNIIKSK